MPAAAPAAGEPRDRLAQRGGTGVAVDDHDRRRPGVARGGLGDGRAVGAGPARPEGTVVEPPGQLGRPGVGLLAVVRQEQAAVLAVGRADVREPAEPAPGAAPLLEGAVPVGADQHDLQIGGGVQGGELGHDRAGEPGEPVGGAERDRANRPRAARR